MDVKVPPATQCGPGTALDAQDRRWWSVILQRPEDRVQSLGQRMKSTALDVTLKRIPFFSCCSWAYVTFEFRFRPQVTALGMRHGTRKDRVPRL